MSIDLAQFHQVYFEESFEGLDIMESGLLNLDIGDVNVEEVNTIFRAAHSIKGGGGTFGFSEISNFTHVMETLLDEMRDGRRGVSQLVVNVLLESVDCLREMLQAMQQGDRVNQAKVAEYKYTLEQVLNADIDSSSLDLPASHLDSSETSSTIQAWMIAFSPHLHLLKNGNDPVRIFREMATMGKLASTVDLQGVPDLYQMQPEDCYLSWKLMLQGNLSAENIDEVFDWVQDDCDFAKQPIYANNPTQVADTVFTETAVKDSAIPAKLSDSVSAQATAGSEIKPSVDGETKEEAKQSAAKGSGSIRVDTSKIDALINMVGELVITQSMLSLVGEHFNQTKLDQLKNGLIQLERHTRELQESVMNIRMLPISFVFNRFPRLAHDMSGKLGKKIELKLIGENTEVDKTVVELISDPLVHLVRNSLDHGIEMPDVRLAQGKPETGTVILEAYHRSGNIVIEVRDDGKGLDKEKLRAKAIEKDLISADARLTDKQIYDLIFLPGFSTAEKLTDISGRGVGMDVVRRNIQSLGGNIELSSELGKGSTIAIHLPLTLAILDGQSIAVGDEVYILPLAAIMESITVHPEQINKVAGKGETCLYRGKYLPVIRLHEVFQVPNHKASKLTEGLLVVVEGQGERCGLFVDDLLGQQQVVIKSLEANYRRVEGVSAATILGDGSVALILDIAGLVRLANQ